MIFINWKLLTSEDREDYIEAYDHNDINPNVLLQWDRDSGVTYEAEYYIDIYFLNLNRLKIDSETDLFQPQVRCKMGSE